MFNTDIADDVGVVIEAGLCPEFRRRVATALADLEQRRAKRPDDRELAMKACASLLDGMDWDFRKRLQVATEAIHESDGWTIRLVIRELAAEARVTAD